MKALFVFALLSFSASASAEIFKCVQPNGELAYQGMPCDELSIEQLINLPPTSAGVQIITEEEIQQQIQANKAEEEALDADALVPLDEDS